jgi:hypothetical protein
MFADDGFGVVPDQLKPESEVVVVGDRHAALAAVNDLMLIETEDADVSERACISPVVGTAGYMRGVAHDLEAAASCDFVDPVHVG